MENKDLTVTMPMSRYLWLESRAGKEICDFLDKLTSLYKLPSVDISGEGIRYSDFESLKEACLEARKLLGYEDPTKWTR